MLSSVSGNFMAAGRAVSADLEDGGTAMKLLNISKKLPPKNNIVLVCLWSSVVTYTHQVHTVMKGSHSAASPCALLSC